MNIKKKKPWPLFFIQVFVLLVIMAIFTIWFNNHYMLALNSQQCLPYTLFIIDKKDKEIPQKKLVAFNTDERMSPFFSPGSKFVKLLIGIPGNKIIILDCKVIVIDNNNKIIWRTSLNEHVLNKLNATCEDFNVSTIIPRDHYFVVGTHPRSFDSRYWGLLKKEQIFGRAYAIF